MQRKGNYMEMESRVFLLAILKKQENETIKDITEIMINTELFTQKDGKKILKQLIKEEYIANDQLTFKGVTLAKEVEREFKI
jgi:hypothetical protein